MKNNVKRTLLALCLVAVVMLGAVAGTVAWLTDATAPVENTFTVGDIEITLTESDNLDLKIIPGKTIKKDPKVTVQANSEACWLFVKIEETNWSNELTYEIADGWTALGTDYPGVYYREVAASDAAQEFAVLKDNQVKVATTVIETEMETMETAAPVLKFTAYAVQKDYVADAVTAWGYTTNNPTSTNP